MQIAMWDESMGFLLINESENEYIAWGKKEDWWEDRHFETEDCQRKKKEEPKSGMN